MQTTPRCSRLPGITLADCTGTDTVPSEDVSKCVQCTYGSTPKK
jgi:hypothetical protein